MMATCNDRIHIEDVGTVFRITLTLNCETPLDISAASAKSIVFNKPDDTILTKTAEFTTDGTDGKIEYISIVTDLDVTGTWKIQGKINLPSGAWSSNIGKFKVYANLS